MRRPALAWLALAAAALAGSSIAAPAPLSPSPAAPPQPLVLVVVVNVRNDHGLVRAALCRPGEFLGKRCHYEASAPAHPGEVSVTFTAIPPGRYAVQAWHDENGDDRIERDLLGIPRQGVGFSNNPRLLLGPPAFEDSALDVSPTGALTRIRLHYFK